MKKKILILFIFLPLYIYAGPNDMIQLFNVKIMDGFYENPIQKAHISVMEKDSITLLVDSLQENSSEIKEWHSYYGSFPRRDQVVLRVQCEGYETCYLQIDVPKNENIIRLTNIIYLWEAMGNELGEANVKASRILMVMKGDTIEYNAAAFRMHEGSMLDNLIRALPGVRLDDDGQITVNGKYVSSLLVDGRDFFNGDPKIALRNLPAYVVNKVKVYRQTGKRKKQENEELDESEKQKYPLVMDVTLKRDYAQGWLNNYEVGGGATLRNPHAERWLGRLFSMRYTNHSSLGIYAGVNNLNDGGIPGSKGEWRKISASDGEKKTYMAGVNFSLDPKDTSIKFSTSLNARRQESVYESTSNSEDYYESGNTYRSNSNYNKHNATDLKWNAKLEGDDKLGDYLITPSFYYRHNKMSDTSTSLNRQETGSDIDTLYTRLGKIDERDTKWGANLNLYRKFGTKKAGDFSFKANFDFNSTPEQNRTEGDNIEYKLNPSNDRSELRRYAMPAKDYRYSFGTGYNKKHWFNEIISTVVGLDYEYSQQFNSGHQDLEISNDDWLTPSSALSWAVETQNSFHTTRMERTHNVRPTLQFAHRRQKECIKRWSFMFSPDFNVVSRQIGDRRGGLFKYKTDDHVLFTPTAQISWWKHGETGIQDVELTASIRHTLPDIYYLIDVLDSSNPLLHYEGNANLRTTRQFSANLRYNHNPFIRKNGKNPNYSLNAGYDSWKNSVGMARLYDRETGTTTMRPYNMDGNWHTYAKFFYSSFVGKDNKWNIYNSTEFDFAHSSDFASDRSDEALAISSADNLSLTENLRADYRISSMRLSAKIDFKWTRLTSCQNFFARLSYTDFNYGLSISTPLLWGFNLDTDIMAYCRRGYADHSMNTTDWVWNMELSRTVGRKKRWIIKAIGFDILGQLSSVRRTVNAQGRTETLYNTMPSYATLNIVYRFEIMPKKK